MRERPKRSDPFRGRALLCSLVFLKGETFLAGRERAEERGGVRARVSHCNPRCFCVARGMGIPAYAFSRCQHVRVMSAETAARNACSRMSNLLPCIVQVQHLHFVYFVEYCDVSAREEERLGSDNNMSPRLVKVNSTLVDTSETYYCCSTMRLLSSSRRVSFVSWPNERGPHR